MEDNGGVLDGLRIASPCGEDWNKMTGDERVRACARCRLNVYNLSELTRAEAEALIISKEGNLCVRIYRRADGTIITRDCPVGLRAARLKLLRLAGAAAALLVVLATRLGWRRGTAPAVPHPVIPPRYGATAGVPVFTHTRTMGKLAPRK